MFPAARQRNCREYLPDKSQLNTCLLGCACHSVILPGSSGSGSSSLCSRMQLYAVLFSSEITFVRLTLGSGLADTMQLYASLFSSEITFREIDTRSGLAHTMQLYAVLFSSEITFRAIAQSLDEVLHMVLSTSTPSPLASVRTCDGLCNASLSFRACLVASSRRKSLKATSGKCKDHANRIAHTFPVTSAGWRFSTTFHLIHYITQLRILPPIAAIPQPQRLSNAAQPLLLCEKWDASTILVYYQTLIHRYKVNNVISKQSPVVLSTE